MWRPSTRSCGAAAGRHCRQSDRIATIARVIANMTPADSALFADAILAIHVGIVAFVVLGEIAFLLGGWCGWGFVRWFWLRVVHVALMVLIAAQAWLGQLCVLTVWEQALRERAGEATYRESFIEHWLSRLLYIDAPWWVFIVAYTLFAALVLATWFWVPPRRANRFR